jgi:hypothetical protein
MVVATPWRKHLGLNAIELLPLRLHQNCHVHEYLMELHQRLL